MRRGEFSSSRLLEAKEGTMNNLGFARIACIVVVFCVVTAVASPAQTLTTIFSFSGTHGSYPGAIIQGTDGNFYGATQYGGTSIDCPYSLGCGTIFKITPEGNLTTLYDFCSKSSCADGATPVGTLAQGTDGNFYGATLSGGANNAANCSFQSPAPRCGTVFRITPAGTLTTIYSFCAQANCADGFNPQAGLIQATNGNFYGTTWEKANSGEGAFGTVFELTPTGKLTTLHSFNWTDGAAPVSGLLQANNGNIYGTTQEGGSLGNGTIFEIAAAGTFGSLYSFAGHGLFEGSFTAPNALIQAAHGSLYGTTYSGGSNFTETWGMVYEVAPGLKLTPLYNFCTKEQVGVCLDGSESTAGLVQGNDGNFYGTTSVGGTGINCPNFLECGTLFEITASGNLTTLYTFCAQTNCSDGDYPYAGLVQATNGNFYGTTSEGGDVACNDHHGCGTVYRLSTGLGPFVAPSPTFGKSGRGVRILGNNLTGTTSVTFNGVPAPFAVVSSTFIKATVPSGATTGTIEVTTPGGTLSSNAPFQVE
jgi:uncharacterized repeat protein (TIGR03803 family)